MLFIKSVNEIKFNFIEIFIIHNSICEYSLPNDKKNSIIFYKQ